MTLIDERLAAYLLAAPLSSPLVSDRVYPSRLPQSVTLPALTYRQVSGPRDYTHDGPSGLVNSRYQVTCWAESTLSAKQLADLVRQDLDASGRQIGDRLMLQNQVDIYEPETQTDTVVLDFMIEYRE